jgi:hypothetical protein
MSTATKIMIIRHAEKPTTTPPPALNGVTITGQQNADSLIVRGWQRAGALVALFAPSKGPLQNSELATPQFIYATSTSDTEGNRPEETITPLAQKLGLAPNESFSKTQLQEVASSAINCNGVVLISWPHGQIPNLCQLIPLSSNNKNPIPHSWPSDRFDVVFVFDLDTSSQAHGYTFSQVPQLLLAGDSADPIPSGS